MRTTMTLRSEDVSVDAGTTSVISVTYPMPRGDQPENHGLVGSIDRIVVWGDVEVESVVVGLKQWTTPRQAKEIDRLVERDRP